MKSNSLVMEQMVIGREGVALSAPIDVTVETGTLLAVRGQNGSGKSTLLKILAGLLPPHSGRALYGDAPIHCRQVLYIGHKLGLDISLSVYDNVNLWSKLYRVPELTAAALHYFDLGDIADVPVRQLSAGWQQRVALTRLITIPSSLWLLDEPTSHLDAAGTGLLQTLLHSRLEQGGVVVMATHHDLQGEFIKSINISSIN